MNRLPFRVRRLERCSRYDFSELYFLNIHGGYDKVLFNKKRYRKLDIDRGFFDRLPGYGYSGVGFFRGDRTRVQYRVGVDEVLTLSSDHVSDRDRVLFEGLLVSGDVYIYSGNEYIPCVVIDGEFNEYTEVNDKLYSYQVNVRLSGGKTIKTI